MDSQFSTISVPNYRRGSSHDSKDAKPSYSSNTNDDFYNLSWRNHRERISTYDKIIHDLSKDERKTFGTPLLSIIGRNEANIMSPNTSAGNNTNVGGTLTLYPSGGILFKNFTSLKPDFPDASSQQTSETKDISNRGTSPIAKSPRQLLDFVEKFNMEEDESLSPDDFLEYRDSQSDDLTTESGGTILYGINKSDSETTHYEAETIINDLKYNNFLDNQTNNQIVAHREEMFPNTLGQLNPLPIMSFPLEASSLKNKVSNSSVFNNFEIPEILSKEKIQNITISSAADSRHTLNLMSRVRSFSISSTNSDDESLNIQDKENMPVSPMSSVSKTESLQASDAVISSTNNSTSNWPIPPTRHRKLSESLSGFFTGFFGSSPTQTLTERSENIKEVAEMSMIFRY